MLGAWGHPWVSARGSNRDVDSFHSWQILATQPWVFMWQKREAGIHYMDRISEKRNSNTWNNNYCFLDLWKVAQSPKTHTSRGACTIMLLLTKITTPHLLTPCNCIIFLMHWSWNFLTSRLNAMSVFAREQLIFSMRCVIRIMQRRLCRKCWLILKLQIIPSRRKW